MYRQLHNYKNLSKTMTERHQTLQAYHTVGSVLPQFILYNEQRFHYKLFSLDALSLINSNPSSCSTSGIFNGVQYRKGTCIIIFSDDHSIQFCKILLLLKDCLSLLFIYEKHETEYHNSVGLLSNFISFRCCLHKFS